jgi:hypothetical protein
MAAGFRFDPPPVEVGADLRWLLARALGPVESVSTVRGSLNASHIFKLAESFDLTARIGARTPHSILIEELGEEPADSFLEAHRQAAARSLMVRELCRELAETGRLLGTPLIFLKGAALLLGGRVAPGARGMGDVDVLAPEEGVHRLQEELIAGGCRPMELRESEHQLQILLHRTGLGVEVHRIIPGVRFDGSKSANAQELISRGFVIQAPGFSEDCHLPADAVLLAHLLVHGIAQHGMAPGSYPMARMLADVQDLGAGADEIEAASTMIERDVSRDEVEAVVTLVRRLETGEDPSTIVVSEDNAGSMLRHILTGTLEPVYAKSMKFGTLTAKPGDKARFAALSQSLWRAVFLTRGQVDILYGTPRSPLGYWGWRLWRPFDLVLRAVRYGWAWVGHRLRKR